MLTKLLNPSQGPKPSVPWAVQGCLGFLWYELQCHHCCCMHHCSQQSWLQRWESNSGSLRMRSYTCNKLLRSAEQRHVSTQDKFCSRLLSTSIVDKISQNTPCTASQPLNLNVSMIYSAVLPPKLPELTSQTLYLSENNTDSQIPFSEEKKNI